MTSPSVPAVPAPQPLTVTTWLILVMAAIGFAFDIYELLMLPLVLPPALQELLPGVAPGSPQFNLWRGWMFWFPALAGGVFGLLGGYLTDFLGRRRVLTWSILLYAFSAFAAGFSTSMPMLLVLRTTTFIGVCIEFVAAVAWLAELFPNPEQREKALGYTQAFSSIGGLLVSGAFLLINSWAGSLPAIQMPGFLISSLGEITTPHAAWRYTLMSGIVPAIPLILIRPFLPESPVWKQKKDAGTLRRPSFGELFKPQLRPVTIIATLMVAFNYGIAFGAIQQIPQIAPGLPQVKAAVAERKEQLQEELSKLDEKARARKLTQETRSITNSAAGQLQSYQEVGGLIGRFLLALFIVRVASRQKLLRLFLIPGLIVTPLVFAYTARNNPTLFVLGSSEITFLHLGIFFVGLLTVAQLSFWGNYLPIMYPVHLRGTGESVAMNVGGRMIGTSFAAVTSFVSGLSFVPGADDATRVAWTAAGVGGMLYLLNLGLSFFLPEPKEETLQE